MWKIFNQTEFPGCFKQEAEIKPVLPAQDNACEGSDHFLSHSGIQHYFFVMKYVLLNIPLLLSTYAFGQSGNLSDTTYLQPVEINSVRAWDKIPVAKTNLSKKELEKNNIGQDLPFILAQTPSVTVNSDAGNGIGYTGIRIRGSDATRINITLNGIPYNDAESQGTFFVDLPDIVSSAGSIQVQRGIGTSSNGAGAFGGSINISTNEVITKRGLEFNNNVGSYHTFRNTLLLNSGIIKKHFTIDGRLSNIRSDGYIDRASSRLASFYTSAAYIDENNSFRINVLAGKEKTYQAWYGIDENTLRTSRTYNSAGTEKPFYPYDNETDNYIQNHYQFFYNHKFNPSWKMNVALFLTKGKGYYEQYKADEYLGDYGLPDYIDGSNTITETDLVRRLWLDNDFYGSIFSFQFANATRQLILGGGWNSYDGKHFGEVIKAEIQPAIPMNYRWYNNNAFKKDFSGYAKWTEMVGTHLHTFLDIQLRSVHYRIDGFSDNPSLNIINKYLFVNPKAGIIYSFNKYKATISYGRSSKEPNRDDFKAGKNEQPRPEILNDIEAGIEQNNIDNSWGINLYYMFYKDQLVLTGKINDVGAYSRINIPRSYRAGLELQGSCVLNKWLSANGNVTISENKIENFTEFIDDYDNGGQQTKFYKKSTIAFSPSIIAAATITIMPVRNAEISLLSKFVGQQYLDNTTQVTRSLDPYYVQDARISYNWQNTRIKEIKVFAQANNLFSIKYEPNGYTFSYIYGGKPTTENFYYPMAPFNWVIGLNVKL